MLDLTLTAIHNSDPLSVPEDGDDLDALVLQEVFQTLGNRAAMAVRALLAQLVWSQTLAVRPGGSLTSFTIDVGGILSLVVADSLGAYRVGTAGATTIGVSKVEGAPGTLGASARWWYVYAFLTPLGAVDYAISLTGPSEYGRTKNGDVTRAYLGCFPTDTTGAPVPLQKVGNRVLYRRSGVANVTALFASNGLRALSRSTEQTSFTAIDLSPAVPPHARVASLDLGAIGDAAPDTALLAVYTDTDTGAPGAQAYTIDHHEVHAHVDVMTSSAQVVKYKLTRGAAGAINGYVDVMGFLE